MARGAEDSPEPASGEAHPGLRARGGEEKAQPSRSPEKGEAVGSPSAPLGGGCQLGGQGLQSGKGRASSEDGVKRRRGVGKKGEVGQGCEVPALRERGDPASRGQGPPWWLWWWLGKDGASVSAPSPSARGQVSPSPHCSETPGPCLCRSALRPCPASSALTRPQQLWPEPQSSRGCPPGSRADGRTGGPGWAVSGRWASLRPSRAAGPLSVLGRANWAGGRLRGPHTTVLTEGSERLSGPVISVGWYCCKIEIHRQGAR